MYREGCVPFLKKFKCRSALHRLDVEFPALRGSIKSMLLVYLDILSGMELPGSFVCSVRRAGYEGERRRAAVASYAAEKSRVSRKLCALRCLHFGWMYPTAIIQLWAIPLTILLTCLRAEEVRVHFCFVR